MCRYILLYALLNTLKTPPPHVKPLISSRLCMYNLIVHIHCIHWASWMLVVIKEQGECDRYVCLMLGHQERGSVTVQPEINPEDTAKPEIDPLIKEINEHDQDKRLFSLRLVIPLSKQLKFNLQLQIRQLVVLVVLINVIPYAVQTNINHCSLKN